MWLSMSTSFWTLVLTLWIIWFPKHLVPIVSFSTNWRATTRIEGPMKVTGSTNLKCVLYLILILFSHVLTMAYQRRCCQFNNKNANSKTELKVTWTSILQVFFFESERFVGHTTLFRTLGNIIMIYKIENQDKIIPHLGWHKASSCMVETWRHRHEWSSNQLHLDLNLVKGASLVLLLSVRALRHDSTLIPSWSVCQSFSLSVSWYVGLSVCLSVGGSVCQSVYWSVCLLVCLSAVGLLVYWSVCLSVCLSVCSSFCHNTNHIFNTLSKL